LCTRGPHPNLAGGWIPFQIKLFIGAWWDLLLMVRGYAPQWEGRR
jgi:hypothetical protein